MLLTTNDDSYLIEDVKQNNSSISLRALVKKHGGVFLKIAKRYTGGTKTVKFPLYEILAQQDAIVFDAIKDFDETKGFKFATWLGSKLKFHCLNSFNAKTKYIFAPPDEMQRIVDTRHFHSNGENDKHGLEISYIWWVVDQMQDQRMQKIMRARYSDVKKLTKFAHIAKELGMTTQGVINLHDKSINFIRKKVIATENTDQI